MAYFQLLALAGFAGVALVSPAAVNHNRDIVVNPKITFFDAFADYYGSTTTAASSGGSGGSSGGSGGSSGGSSSCKCGILKRSTRIVGGTDAAVNEYPYHVGLLLKSETQITSNMFCGATLISDRYIITAAHCTPYNDFANSNGKVAAIQHTGSFLAVVLGGHDLTDLSSASIIYAKKLTNHPQFTPQPPANDIAVIEIAPLDLTNLGTGILPACMPTDTTKTYVGETVTVTGWGDLQSGGSSPNILQEVELSVVSNADCSKPANYGATITSSMMCAAAPGKDSCQKDSGGPLVHIVNNQATLVGVVSFGEGCADVKPGVYARVTSYLSWISSVTGSLNTCSA